MRQVISREVALTEVYLDTQARAWEWERTPAKVWASELAKAIVWIVGVVLFVVLMALLAPDARADSIPTQPAVASYLDLYTPLPLAVGVDKALALNLLAAQRDAWGSSSKLWYPNSLQLSEDAVLRAIALYIWPGGPSIVTNDKQLFSIIWDQSTVAVDPRLSGGFDVTVANFGEAPVVSTPEPATWFALAISGLGLALIRRIYKRQP